MLAGVSSMSRMRESTSGLRESLRARSSSSNASASGKANAWASWTKRLHVGRKDGLKNGAVALEVLDGARVEIAQKRVNSVTAARVSAGSPPRSASRSRARSRVTPPASGTPQGRGRPRPSAARHRSLSERPSGSHAPPSRPPPARPSRPGCQRPTSACGRVARRRARDALRARPNLLHRIRLLLGELAEKLQIEPLVPRDPCETGRSVETLDARDRTVRSRGRFRRAARDARWYRASVS